MADRSPGRGQSHAENNFLHRFSSQSEALLGRPRHSFGCVSRRFARFHLELTWKICLRGRSWCFCGRVRFCHLLRVHYMLLLRDLWPPLAREVRIVGKIPFQGGPAPLRKEASAAMSAAEDVLRRNRQTRRDAIPVALSVFGVSVTHRSQRHIFCLRTLNPSLSQRCRFHSTLGEGVRRTSPEEFKMRRLPLTKHATRTPVMFRRRLKRIRYAGHCLNYLPFADVCRCLPIALTLMRRSATGVFCCKR